MWLVGSVFQEIQKEHLARGLFLLNGFSREQQDLDGHQDSFKSTFVY